MHHEMNASDLRGKSVIDNRGNDFGEIEDLTMDPDQWRVTGLVVNVRREVADRLKLDRPMLGSATIVVGSERVQQFGDHVVLNIGVEEMGGLLHGRE